MDGGRAGRWVGQRFRLFLDCAAAARQSERGFREPDRDQMETGYGVGLAAIGIVGARLKRQAEQPSAKRVRVQRSSQGHEGWKAGASGCRTREGRETWWAPFSTEWTVSSVGSELRD